MNKFKQEMLNNLKDLRDLNKAISIHDKQIRQLQRSISHYIEQNDCCIYFEDIVDFFENCSDFNKFSKPETINKRKEVISKINELQEMIAKDSKYMLEIALNQKSGAETLRNQLY